MLISLLDYLMLQSHSGVRMSALSVQLPFIQYLFVLLSIASGCQIVAMKHSCHLKHLNLKRLSGKSTNYGRKSLYACEGGQSVAGNAWPAACAISTRTREFTIKISICMW